MSKTRSCRACRARCWGYDGSGHRLTSRRIKASRRWNERQQALPSPGQVVLGFAGSCADVHVGDTKIDREARKRKLDFEDEERIARQKGLSDYREEPPHPPSPLMLPPSFFLAGDVVTCCL